MSDPDPDDDDRWMTPEDQIGALKARVENLLRDRASLTRLAQSVPLLQARVEALTAALAVQKARADKAEAALARVRAALPALPQEPTPPGVLADLAAGQERLGADFEAVIEANIDKLFEA